MSTTADVLPTEITAEAAREARRERWQGHLSRAAGTLNLLGHRVDGATHAARSG